MDCMATLKFMETLSKFYWDWLNIYDIWYVIKPSVLFLKFVDTILGWTVQSYISLISNKTSFILLIISKDKLLPR
jgi:hypothetical protein